ncbi:YciI-like protein [Breoghania sp.]|uniref:YciI-like protein n=1 Tax=Breoghania sp. TaxID=2065378 RepID=UPI00260BD4A7|nr:YciI-like protein [Breoghania sp.]MDJ0932771.1 YciI-like protein [Breoghania sp.]
MLYALMCTDKPNSLQIRLDTRPDHLVFLESLGDAVKFAGPFLGEDGKPCGSMVMVEADSKEATMAIAERDPYAKKGLFSAVEARPWAWAVKNPEA